MGGIGILFKLYRHLLRLHINYLHRVWPRKIQSCDFGRRDSGFTEYIAVRIEAAVIASVSEHNAVITLRQLRTGRVLSRRHDEQSCAVRLADNFTRHRRETTQKLNVDAFPVEWFRTLYQKRDRTGALIHARRSHNRSRSDSRQQF